MPSSLLDVAGSDFRPLTKILDCSLRMKFGSFSSPMGQTCLPTLLAIIGLVSLYPTNYLIAKPSLRMGAHTVSFLYPSIRLNFSSTPSALSSFTLPPYTK